MDWKTWAAVGLSVLGLILWQVYYAGPASERQREQAASRALEPHDREATRDTRDARPDALATPTPLPTPTPEAPAMVAPRSETLTAGDVQFTFNNDTGGIEEVLLLMHQMGDKEAVFLNRDRKMPIGAVGTVPGEALGGFEMEVDRTRGRVVFTKEETDGMRIRKEFFLPDEREGVAQYVVRMNLEFVNTSSGELQRLGYFVNAGSAAPVYADDWPIYTRFDWYRDGKMRSVDTNWFAEGRIPLIGIQTRGARPVYSEAQDSIEWVAVSSQYFCTVLTSRERTGISVWATRFDTRTQKDSPVFGIQGAMGLEGFRLAAGERRFEQFEIYAGPKQQKLLNQLGQGQADIMRFGMFRWVSEFLLWAMNSINRFTGNYAAAIIILTILIKLVLWPIQNKATQSMRRMSLLAPKMTELREKYKDNPQKMNEELMKLYKDYGINPFSGCVPLLIQIPIFFGFYSMLGVAIELRNASFLWIRDLSQPDTVGHILGFPINLLPIIMAGTMIWQIAITPKTGDKMQQRIFFFMPVIFLVFCYNFASALALYWTTQNIFSIVQLYLTRNQPLPTLEKKSVAAKKALEASKKTKRKGRKQQP